MPCCAFLTMDCLDGYVSDDHLLIAPLEQRGWTVTMVSWEQPGIDWSQYDLVLIRTPWNYHRFPDTFLETLQRIEHSTSRLENPTRLVRWNLRKTYLRELAHQGVAIVPSLWGHGIAVSEIDRFFDQLASDTIVLKPVVGANADDTYRLRKPLSARQREAIATTYADRGYLVQPFLNAIIREGEFSLIYFAGGFSHAILKTPNPGDFRVQEEHGGLIQSVTPEPALRQQADSIMSCIRPAPLYGRVDLVREGPTRFRLMELELIEPALYLRMDASSADRFANVIDQRCR